MSNNLKPHKKLATLPLRSVARPHCEFNFLRQCRSLIFFDSSIAKYSMIEKALGQPIVEGLGLERHKFMTIINEQHHQINTLRSNIREVERRCENQQRKLEKLLAHLANKNEAAEPEKKLQRKEEVSPPKGTLLMTQSVLVRSPTDYQMQLPFIKVSVEKLRPLDNNEVRRRRQQLGYE